MSKFACKCGNIISDVVCPNEVTGSVLSHKSHDKFFDDVCSIINDCLDHDKRGAMGAWMKKHFNDMYPKDLPMGEMLHDAIHARHRSLTLAVMECDKCGRLWIQSRVGENHYQEYVPGSQDQTKVLGLNQQEENG
jgi:hypothetical protein